MKPIQSILATIAIVLVGLITGCSGGGDEESTVQLALSDTYDNVRAGAHLIMSYDAATNSFKGTVKNTTNGTLTRVRVEIHLSNGVELGPTPPIDLASGETRPIVLKASGTGFDAWTAHPEVGGSTA